MLNCRQLLRREAPSRAGAAQHVPRARSRRRAATELHVRNSHAATAGRERRSPTGSVGPPLGAAVGQSGGFQGAPRSARNAGSAGPAHLGGQRRQGGTAGGGGRRVCHGGVRESATFRHEECAQQKRPCTHRFPHSLKASCEILVFVIITMRVGGGS